MIAAQRIYLAWVLQPQGFQEVDRPVVGRIVEEHEVDVFAALLQNRFYQTAGEIEPVEGKDADNPGA